MQFYCTYNIDGAFWNSENIFKGIEILVAQSSSICHFRETKI